MTEQISDIPMMRITPSEGQISGATEGAAGNGDFASALSTAVNSAIATGQSAETESLKAITQGGNLTEVATAVAQAELTLQTTTAIRDRMLQAYQDVMRIQI